MVIDVSDRLYELLIAVLVTWAVVKVITES